MRVMTEPSVQAAVHEPPMELFRQARMVAQKSLALALTQWQTYHRCWGIRTCQEFVAA